MTDHEREIANLRRQIAVLTAEPVMIFADGRQPTENERHLHNLLRWRQTEAEQAKEDMAAAREQVARLKKQSLTCVWCRQELPDLGTLRQHTALCESHPVTAERKRAEKAEAFKTWTHAYLDAHGVPHHPPGTHGAEGCRIGDRLDWLMAKINKED